MAENDYIKIPRSMFEDEYFQKEPFSKIQAWLDLIFLALPEDKDFTMRGVLIHGKKGEAYISRGMLAKRWQWSDKKVVRFLEHLKATQLATQPTTQPSSWVTSCISIQNYDSHIGSDPTNDPTGDPTSKVVTQLATQPTTQPSSWVNSLNTTTYRAAKMQATQPTTQLATQLSDSLQEKEENKETEKRKKKSPVPPIKEINKEKEIKEEKELSPENFISGGVKGQSDLVLTCESSAKKKKPAKKKSEEEYTLTYRARLCFSDFYKERYGEEKYWKMAEIAALSQLLKQIKFSREHRNIPLPTDDDSILIAFKEFLNRICTPWVLQNFLVTNINSKYDTIVQDIKNNRYGTSVSKTTNNGGKYQTDYDRGRAQCEAQKQDFAAQLAELEYKLKTKQIIPPSEQPQGGGTEIELPDF